MELISRDEAIKAVEEVTCDVCEHRSTWCASCDKVEALIRIHSLPTIEERKEGHWIILEEPKEGIPKRWRVRCLICHKTLRIRDKELWEFCPHCGAKMKGE